MHWNKSLKRLIFLTRVDNKQKSLATVGLGFLRLFLTISHGLWPFILIVWWCWIANSGCSHYTHSLWGSETGGGNDYWCTLTYVTQITAIWIGAGVFFSVTLVTTYWIVSNAVLELGPPDLLTKLIVFFDEQDASNRKKKLLCLYLFLSPYKSVVGGRLVPLFR